MFTNELKKGDRVRLRNGWFATIEDNLKGNTRLATVEGYVTEMGSVYSHDIVFKVNPDGSMERISYTPNQLKCQQRVLAMGF